MAVSGMLAGLVGSGCNPPASGEQELAKAFLPVAGLTQIGLLHHRRLPGGLPKSWKTRDAYREDTWPTVAQLLERGPQFYRYRDVVTGYALVRGGWPAFVEAELEEAGPLEVQVALQGGQPRKFSVEGGGSFELPPEFGETLQVGAFTIRTPARIGERAVPFHLVGLAAGGGALSDSEDLARARPSYPQIRLARAERVAVLAIGAIQFGPPRIQFGRGQAEYSFRLRKDFNQLEVRIFRQPAGPRDEFGEVWRQRPPGCTPSQGRECRSNWDGRNLQGKAAAGSHSLEVVAWLTAGAGEGPWCLGASHQVVQVTKG